jgi:hypothetical protein
MREGCLAASSHMQTQQPNATTAGSTASCAAAGLHSPFVVDLPYSAQQLAALLDILYEHNLEVRLQQAGLRQGGSVRHGIQQLLGGMRHLHERSMSVSIAVSMCLLASRAHLDTRHAVSAEPPAGPPEVTLHGSSLMVSQNLACLLLICIVVGVTWAFAAVCWCHTYV